ncbi:Sugar kinase of the NBD/HSP70 family, may contain an N-terminal HTH domain [Asanoa hainanensis]|uniref:Sugar kinase of the NBD/HSP70 family, may contain an N-terminal HTH domain n=1 Tax=Asanoa hainanensis TaxID=560556 RepID=A0A239NI85_9ACTN|nr:ROK family transcriptional regulator [Asanoa hainanensis]SNT54657.1 Sugar kinase of the NBD/HSP70 family, may contain an N-terminal HTH domain [Asanoa hainanensis]
MARSGQASPRGDLVRAAVLGVLGTRGASSRADIARVLGVSPATVTQTTKELLQRRLVTELRSVPSNGGRPATLLGLVRAAGGAIGAKVTADHVAVVTVDLDGTVRSARSEPFDPARPAALEALSGILREVVTAHDGHLLGVGVGLPGAVDAQASGMVDAPTLGWSQVPVGRRLRDALGVPVLVDNDVNTLAAAQMVYGHGREHANFMVVTIGLGIGCGMVHQGSVSRGAHGGAGEIGHIPVSADGPACGCGNTGCLEAYIGEAGLVAAAVRAGAIGPRGTIATLAKAARAGQPAALEVYHDAGRLLGRTLAGVVHTVDPELVVLMGEGIRDWAFWETGFEEAFRRQLMPARRGIRCLVESWTEDQWAVGAASLVLASPFDAAAAGAQGELVRARLQTGPEAAR